MIAPKASRTAQGISIMTLKKDAVLESAVPYEENMLPNSHRYRAKSIPAAGAFLRPEENQGQLTF